jgi:hypothetical protein
MYCIPEKWKKGTTNKVKALSGESDEDCLAEKLIYQDRNPGESL